MIWLLNTFCSICFWGVIIGVMFFFLARVFFRIRLPTKLTSSTKRLAFFHPYCHSGGGGEKVLFTMISGLLSFPNPQHPLEIAIYTGDTNPEAEILAKVERNFNLKLPLNQIKFIRISGRKQNLDPKPFLTMIRQIIGSILFTYKCLRAYPPDLFFDTTGFSFSHWVVKQLIPDCKVISYVHYPFISFDMLDCVVKKEKKFNNTGRIADSKLLSWVKVWYYRTLIFLYGKMGDYADLVFTNSSWTNTHIRSLWKKWRNDSLLLYPPCNIDQFLKFKETGRSPIIVSFAQFRPEKDHLLQLEVFKTVKSKLPHLNVKLVLCGSCRDESDELLLQGLKNQADIMGISSDVSFKKNLKFEELLQVFSEATIGLHTMKAEHFGIAIVEMIAAGLIVVAHNSAGPKYDIIKEKIDNFGFLCKEPEDYINAIMFIFGMNEEKKASMIKKGRKEMERFDTKSFIKSFLDRLYTQEVIWKH